MALLSLPYQVQITVRADGKTIAQCRDGDGNLLQGPYSVYVNGSFDTQNHPNSIGTFTSRIDMGGQDSGQVQVAGAVAWKSIRINCKADGTAISTTTNEAGVILHGPYVIGVNEAFGANRIVLGGQDDVGASFVTTTTGPPAPVTNVALGDTLAMVQTKLNAVPAGGSLRFPGGYTITGSLTGKSNITLWADDDVLVNGTMNFQNTAGWTIRGATPGHGFRFNGVRVNTNDANGNWFIGNCIFNNAPTFADGNDGSAVGLNGASFGSIINCDFNNCQGTVLGKYTTDNITVDGCHFINCRQPFSLQQGTSTSSGRNWTIQRCVFSGTTRAAMEFGPSSTTAEYFTGLVVSNNYFTGFNYTPNSDNFAALLAISLVGQASTNTTVANNWIDMGLLDRGHGAAIEFTGTGECTNNTILNWLFEGFLYQFNWNYHDNFRYNVGIAAFPNPSNYTGTLEPSTVLTTAPRDPGWPARISW